MFYRFLVFVLFGVGFATLFRLAADVLDTPVVYQDAISRNCVAVEDPNGLRSCKQQPARFDVVYVEPGLTFQEMARMRGK